LVGARLGEAVELIDYDWVPDIIHVNITECYS
jgi:hypothetical protein